MLSKRRDKGRNDIQEVHHSSAGETERRGTTMTTRREFLTTGATLVATGVLTETLTACAAPANRPSEPPLDEAKVEIDIQAFLDMSALLTGLNARFSNDRFVNEPVAKEYARRLRGTFLDDFTGLLTAYKELVAVDPPPKIDDALLKRFRTTPEFKKNDEIVAKQIVNIWYFSQFNDSKGEVVDGGFYERGYVWAVIKSPPIGFSTKRPGYWTVEPAKEETF